MDHKDTILETGRLVLRRYRESDLQDLFEYLSDPEVVRGQHANRETEFLLVNVSGTSRVRVDNGRQSKVIELNRPRMGLYLSPMVWKDMYDFSEDSVLLVLASRHYDAAEYIRDYPVYLAELGKMEGRADE